MRIALLIALCGCRQILGFDEPSVLPPGDAIDVDGMEVDARRPDGAPGAARKQRISIDPSKVTGNLTGFPLLFVLDSPTMAAKATLTGDDIYFTRTDGTPLEFELVKWDKTTGHLEAWVRVDLSDAAVTELDLRYGDPGPAHAPNPPLAFSNGFVAVWHFDTLSGTTLADARGLHPGTAVNGPLAVAGRLGGGLAFDGTNDEVSFTNPLTGSGSHTISAWVRLNAPAAGFSSVMTIGNAATNQSRFLWTKYTGLATGFYGNDEQSTVDVNNATYTLLHWVYDGGTKVSTLYRDGAALTQAGVTGAINTTGTGGHIGNAPVAWGPGGNTPNPANGVIDEVRIANVARSAGWIATEQRNQASPTAFYSLSVDQPAQ